jgi:hypothetical protein
VMASDTTPTITSSDFSKVALSWGTNLVPSVARKPTLCITLRRRQTFRCQMRQKSRLMACSPTVHIGIVATAANINPVTTNVLRTIEPEPQSAHKTHEDYLGFVAHGDARGPSCRRASGKEA